nr:kinesin-like protein KIF15 [Biomphalaria glabrata]
MTLQKFEKDNKVLQAKLKHTEVCEQKAPEVPNFQVIKNIELAYSRKMEEFERSIFGKDKKVAELLFEVAKLKEELHLARETHASVLKDRNCNKMGAEFQSAVPMQGGAIGEPGERKSSSEKNGSVRECFTKPPLNIFMFPIVDEKLYWTKGTAEIDEGNRGDGNKVELEEQKITKENLRKRMCEVKELDITADNLVKSLESSLKEKEHEVKQEQQRNRELDAKFKILLQEKESIEAQLQKILDNHYTEKSELSSKIKSLQEEKKTLKDELAALEELNAQLVEESNHINTNQKIQLCDKKNEKKQ